MPKRPPKATPQNLLDAQEAGFLTANDCWFPDTHHALYSSDIRIPIQRMLEIGECRSIILAFLEGIEMRHTLKVGPGYVGNRDNTLGKAHRHWERQNRLKEYLNPRESKENTVRARGENLDVSNPKTKRALEKIHIQKALSRIRNTIQDTDDLERLIENHPCRQLRTKIRSMINYSQDMDPFVPYIENCIEIAELIINHDCADQDTCKCYREANTDESA